MFTVIFLSEAARRIFDRSKAFFDPFVESGQIAFCDWVEDPPADATLADVLPGLADAIKGKSAWRAVVVDHVPGGYDPERDVENPFDYVANTDPALSLEDSPHRLVRIGHWLLGYPHLTAKTFTPVVVWRDEDGRQQRERPELPESDELSAADREAELALAAQRLAGARQQKYADVAIQYEEVAPTDAQRAAHRLLSDKYQMKEVHPYEVAFVCTRARVGDDEHAQLQRAWQTGVDHPVSRFVERNDYPVSSRFAVYDLLNQENSGYPQDELRFWMSVLTLATNELPPAAFQADRVYEIGVLVDKLRLGEMLNAQISVLSAFRDHVDSVIRRPVSPPAEEVSELPTDTAVTVEFDQVGGNDLVVRTSGYGLAVDYPRSEVAMFNDDFANVEAGALQFLRKPRRVLARAVFDARRKSRAALDVSASLNDIEREEIEDELARRVKTLTVPATATILDRDRLLSMLQEERSDVGRQLASRMKIQTVGVATTLVLAVWLGALTPYLLQSIDKGGDSLTWSAFTVALVLVVLGATGLVTLLLMRRRLVSLLRRTNARLQAFVTGVNSGAADFAEYLSGLVSYMRARAMLRTSARWQEREFARMGRLRALRNTAAQSIQVQKDIVHSLGVPLDVRRVNLAVADLDIDDRRHTDAYFRFPIGDRPAALNDSGQTVAAPYDFITGFLVEPVRLFERASFDSSDSGTSA